ncbi:hypothetical protein SDC9_07189 [bioreactor metagenome]|uniref:DNA invertase/resolvase n=2 Tax=root TaxID=1 RepID=D2BJ93_DEHMV|nr:MULTISPECIES: recombinase family protein [Dehalococcoides]ACZ62393.1 DNA invertase/resolvase [Dehalococcoides mccartyi VS]AGG08443.1 resolvase domain protein [Dehalococcoides mccartyi BTF08]WRX71655.1 DNA invertase/resolvase [Dehalococcoides mccartyi]
MKVAIYQRRLKSDQGQIPSFQDLRDFALGQGWEIYNQYQDNVSIAGNSRRNAWQELLADAALSKFDLVLIPQIDEVFSSVMDMAKTLGKLKVLRIGLRSYSEPWFDITSISGEALYRLSLSYAALEKDRHHRKLKSGLAHARKMGCQIGRPRVTKAGLQSGLWRHFRASQSWPDLKTAGCQGSWNWLCHLKETP